MTVRARKVKREKLHASCVSISSRGVLFTGASGSGKSDLSLRLIAFMNATLVADDQVIITAEDGRLKASADPKIRGLLEVRGIGLVNYPVANEIALSLVVELVEREDVPRIPEPASFELLGIKIPKIRLPAYDASTPAKIQAALHAQSYQRLHTGFIREEDNSE